MFAPFKIAPKNERSAAMVTPPASFDPKINEAPEVNAVQALQRRAAKFHLQHRMVGLFGLAAHVTLWGAAVDRLHCSSPARVIPARNDVLSLYFHLPCPCLCVTFKSESLSAIHSACSYLCAPLPARRLCERSHRVQFLCVESCPNYAQINYLMCTSCALIAAHSKNDRQKPY